MKNLEIYRMSIFIFLWLFTFKCILQHNRECWAKEFKPLKTDKTAVKNLLGNPSKINDNDYYLYSTEDGVFDVNYTQILLV